MNSGSGTIIMLILMVVIFYVFLLLPEIVKRKNSMRCATAFVPVMTLPPSAVLWAKSYP